MTEPDRSALDSAAVHRDRTAKLLLQMQSQGVAAFLVMQPENRRYLTGFTGGSGWVLVSGQGVHLITDFRYWEQAHQEAPTARLVKTGTSGESPLLEALSVTFAELDLKGRVAFEEEVLSVAALRRLAGALNRMEWVGVSGWVEELRIIKEEAEIAAIRASVAVAESAFRQVASRIAPGISERRLAAELEYAMALGGASREAFDLIVASGPNAALPHAQVTDRILQEGDLVTIDWGCVVDGYNSDMTRTFLLGEGTGRAREIYRVVLEAQERALAGIRAGTTGAQADALAREVITRAGYGEYFGHGLGHGVGLAVHEGPRLRQKEGRALAAGMIVTVEPGIYLPGFGGVRIEDLVAITGAHLRVLTGLPKGTPEPNP